eukprot:2258365-Alexandrium_andersonii.AAC.1
MGGWSVWAGGAAQQTPDPLQNPRAGASWGQGWADSSPVQGQPREYSVDLRIRPDAYALLDLGARPQGYRLWQSKARGYLLGKFPQ